MTDRPPLDATEAAARLGVKRQTLYAYVSRGQLRSRPSPGGRGSVFDADEVDALLRRSRVGREAAQELTIATAISSIADGELRYRGRLVPELASTEPFESVASLLWTGELAWRPCGSVAASLAAVEAVGRAVPLSARLIDRIRLATDAAAVADPLRFELAAASVTTCGRALIGVLVDGLERRSRRRRAVPLVLPGHAPHPDAVATRLWPRLSPLPATEATVRALNGTLVLCADHELATSTFAVRVAASTRANPYAALAAGLGALDGPLHGTVSELVHRLLADAERDGVDAAVARRLRHGDRLPGFGHPLYPGGDPRAPALLELLEADGFDATRRDVAVAVLDAVVGRTGATPNSDFGLGSLAFAGRMTPDAGEAMFAIGRCAGWLAHALEEYAEAPLRFRLRARTLP
jgi:citrate synthase